jgi:hypothetical protein
MVIHEPLDGGSSLKRVDYYGDIPDPRNAGDPPFQTHFDDYLEILFCNSMQNRGCYEGVRRQRGHPISIDLGGKILGVDES